MLALKIVLPQMYNSIVGAPAIIFAVHTGGANTIGEASSIFDKTGAFWGISL